MSQEINTNGMEKEVLTAEQLKEQKAVAKAESVERGLEFLAETEVLGADFGKVVDMAKTWAVATNEEKAEMRKAYAESFETKEELRVYSSETLVADLEKLADLVNTVSILKSVYNGVKKLGGSGKKRVSKKDVQVVFIGDDQYQVRKVDIIASQNMEHDEKVSFLLNCEDTQKIEVIKFDVL